MLVSRISLYANSNYVIKDYGDITGPCQSLRLMSDKTRKEKGDKGNLHKSQQK